MPPISWASKWRWPRTRQAASRTSAKASTSRSSSVSPLARRSRNSGRHGLQLLVRARLHLRLEGVDQRHQLGEAPDLLALAGAEDFREHAHGGPTLLSTASRQVTARDRVPPPHGPGPPEPRGPADGRRQASGAQAVRTFRYRDTVAAMRWRGWDRPTIRPLVRSIWCSNFSTTRSTAIERGLAGGPGPDGVPVAGHHHLAALTVGDPRVVLLGEVDLGPLEAGTVLADVAHLLLGQGSNLVGHDLPAMRDDYVHCFASSASLIDSYCTGWPVLLVGR